MGRSGSLVGSAKLDIAEITRPGPAPKVNTSVREDTNKKGVFLVVGPLRGGSG